MSNFAKKGEAKKNTDDNPTTHVFACWLHQTCNSIDAEKTAAQFRTSFAWFLENVKEH